MDLVSIFDVVGGVLEVPDRIRLCLPIASQKSEEEHGDRRPVESG